MTRPRRDRRGGPARGHDRRPAPAPRPRRAWPLLAAAVLVGGLAWWRLHPAPPAPPDAAAAIQALSPEDAFRQAVALHNTGGARAALPYYRRAIAGMPRESWALHYSYAAALQSLITGHRTTRGMQMSLVGSSDEAAAFAKDALAEYTLAAQLARRPADRALVLQRVGDLYWVWGLPWEAFASYREGHALDPGNATIAARGDGLMLLLEHPDRAAALARAPE